MGPETTVPSPPVPATRGLQAFLGAFLRFAGWRAPASLALTVGLGLTQGAGILLLVPMLQVVGVGGGGSGSSSGAATLAARALGALGLSGSLPGLLGLYVALVATNALAQAGQQNLGADLTQGFTKHLRDELFRAVAGVGWVAFLGTRTAAVGHALTQGVQRAGMAAYFLLQAVATGTLAAVFLGLAWALSPRVTLLAAGCGALLVWLLRSLHRRARQSGQLEYAWGKDLFAAAEAHLAGLKIAKSFGREDAHVRHFEAVSGALADQIVRFTRHRSRSQLGFQVGAAIAVALFAHQATTTAKLPPEELLVLLFLFARLLPLFQRVQDQAHQVANALPAFHENARLLAELEAGREPGGPPTGGPLALERALEFRGVTFRYPTRDEPALRGVSLRLPRGGVTAVVGPSGGGKSTLADCALGLLVPQGGEVLLDGVPLGPERLRTWRLGVGYVPQEAFLFHDTIRANLAFADPEAPEGRLREALAEASALAFVEALPEGLDTVVGDRGVRLSGGERQRLALARALVRRPALLVLDEATSNLDPENERRIQEAVERLRGQTTILLIAHRLSTVRWADRIAVLEDGALAEEGTWDELAARPGGRLRALLLGEEATPCR